MLKAISLLVAAAIVFKFDYSSIKSGKKRERRVYMAFYAISLGLLMLHILDVQIPYIVHGIGDIYHPIFESFNQRLDQHQSLK
ncbi:hypothetical protein GWK91_01610 [Virgibacillus sp. MSP4-1]|uniref:hypothetical protein n=1 Tax=Virgibacillus sp. MSP4-1 TaxID=2700081 RepID=UPI0003A5B959|nr:hypothetical protein [Virgibacillus sp. MSP4-1]QHS21722.1 hypothetical protein GWK91_01610 [Virgibacillus sp. MSP4-1]